MLATTSSLDLLVKFPRPSRICEMAAVLDYFTIGSTVWCRTCYNAEIEGEVMAFDPQVKILILSILFIVQLVFTELG